MFVAILPLALGYLLDSFFGDPKTKYHPICIIGSLISFLEEILIDKGDKNEEPKGTKSSLIIKGIVLSAIVMTASFAVPFFFLRAIYVNSTFFGVVFESILCFFILARRSLVEQSMAVYDLLEKDDIIGARKALSMIVGRDTENLDEEQIARAATETVAENTNDGVIAPMFFMTIGFMTGIKGLGSALGLLYKAVNTLDSMVAYRNKRYENFGKSSAIIDDIFGFIPARISAVLIIISSAILDLDYKNAIYIFKRDRYNHKSPNSAQSESACAGALGIMLGGDSYYSGVLSSKPTIGDSINLITREDIALSEKLLNVSSAIFLYIGLFLIFTLNFSI